MQVLCNVKFEAYDAGVIISSFQKYCIKEYFHLKLYNINRAHASIISFNSNLYSDLELLEKLSTLISPIASLKVKTTSFQAFPASGTLFLGVNDSKELFDIRMYIWEKLGELQKYGIITCKRQQIEDLKWHITVCSGLPKNKLQSLVDFGNYEYKRILNNELNFSKITIPIYNINLKRHLRKQTFELIGPSNKTLRVVEQMDLFS